MRRALTAFGVVVALIPGAARADDTSLFPDSRLAPGVSSIDPAATPVENAAPTTGAGVTPVFAPIPFKNSQLGWGLAVMAGVIHRFDPDTTYKPSTGAVGGFYETRAFTAFAVPAATPPEIVKTLSDALIEAGNDPKVKTVLANYLIGPPSGFEETNKRFKRDSELMLGILRDLGLKPA